MSPRAMRSFDVFSFGSTHHALDAEQLLDDMGVEVVPIPTPKSVDSSCGISLRVPAEEADRAAEYLARADISVKARSSIEDY